MGALGNLFKKILPLIMVICTLCVGITHMFKTPNLTYLREENVTSEITNETIQYYKFDTNAYMNNLSAELLLDSLNYTKTLETYWETIQSFKTIWQDGYQLFDITKTIANSVILLIDTLLFPINILLIPFRMTNAIILTTLSFIGINISIKTGIINFLKNTVYYAEIPLIKPWINSDETVTNPIINTSGSVFYIKDNPFTVASNKQYNFDFYCVNEDNTQWDEYHAIKINYYGPTVTNFQPRWELQYLNDNNQWITIATKQGNNTITWNTTWPARFKNILVGENAQFTNEDWLSLFVNIELIADTRSGQDTQFTWETPPIN